LEWKTECIHAVIVLWTRPRTRSQPTKPQSLPVIIFKNWPSV